MKTFKINKNTNAVETTKRLAYDEILVSGGSLCLITDKDDTGDIVVGSLLCFDKFAYGDSGRQYKISSRDVTVKDIVVEDDKRYIYIEYPRIRPLVVSSFIQIYSGDTEEPDGYKLYFTENHGMVPVSASDEDKEYVYTDFDTYESEQGKDYAIYVRRGNNIVYFTGIELCYPNEYVRGANIFGPDGECCPEDDTYFNYDTMERNSVIASTFEIYAGETFYPEPGDKVTFATNEYFFTDASGVVHTYENVTVSKYTNYRGLNVVLEEDYDAKRMFQEYQVNELFVKKIKSTIIPDFIDLEKVKYAPAYSGDSVYLATGLTFNLHFRTRVSDRNNRYKFDPTWHLNELVDTWNNNGVNSSPVKRKNLYADENFVNSSNLMGYLDFDDDDIYNQKNRVKQSFLRISFYDSTNPLEQNLLYYSTIFIDTGDLFGKYVKRKAWMEETSNKRSSMLTPVVWSPTGATDPVPAVTSQLIVNDEYDMTRSGEGFNLYLFKQDAPIENDPQDIYMKIEFNHAGNGRTIPLIFWRKDGNNEPVKLNIGNYFKNLYIKVKIALTDKGYVYSFPNAVSAEDNEKGGRKNGIVWENDRLVLNLFEPKLELEGEQVPEPTEINTRVTGQFVQDDE